MSAPAIGICAAIERVSWGVWDGYEVTLAPRGYVTAVQRAGGARRSSCRPTRRRSRTPTCCSTASTRLMLAGGADIDPATYGAEPHAETKGTWPERDRFELALTRRALERDMPVLGICRGMQLLNVALGGTLDQHLPESIGSEVHRTRRRHLRRARGAARAGLARPRARPATEGLVVRSHHHQGVDRLGEGLRVSGWSVRRRPGRGDRAARQALRPRRRLAPRGGRGQPR